MFVASTSTRVDQLIRDTPVSIQLMPRSVVDSKASVLIENALRNVSGVRLQQRRFTVVRGFPGLDLYLNGAPTFSFSRVP